MTVQRIANWTMCCYCVPFYKKARTGAEIKQMILTVSSIIKIKIMKNNKENYLILVNHQEIRKDKDAYIIQKCKYAHTLFYSVIAS